MTDDSGVDLGRVAFVVPAAGKGERMGAGVSKQYLSLAGRPLLAETLERLLALQPQQVVLVVAADDVRWRQIPGVADCTVVTGGASRAESVQQGLKALAPEIDWVMVHDAARPCVRAADIRCLYNTVSQSDTGGLLGVPVTDTVKSVADGRVLASPAREQLWLAQTPQMFPPALLQRALEQARATGLNVTDEASAVEALGLAPLMVAGSRDNIKVTHAGDLALAAFYLAQQAEAAVQCE